MKTYLYATYDVTVTHDESAAELAPDPESTSAGFRAFLSDPESKICEKPDPESLFNFGSGRSLCGHFFSKNMGKSGLD